MDITALVDHLKKRHFDAQYYQTPGEVLDALRKIVQKGWTVGFGGSGTLRELGIPAMLNQMDIATIDHWEEGIDKSEDWKRRLQMGRCDLFMTSVNACTDDGRLVLVDGIGNRVAAAIFGPTNVIHVFGTNKIVDGGIHQAVARIKKIAGPKRAKSLGVNTPCVETGECEDCRSKQRICRARLILDAAPMATPSKVWIVEGAYGY